MKTKIQKKNIKKDKYNDYIDLINIDINTFKILDEINITKHIENLRDYQRAIALFDFTKNNINKYIEFLNLIPALKIQFNQYIKDKNHTKDKYDYIINNYKIQIQIMKEKQDDFQFKGWLKNLNKTITLYCFNSGFAFKKLTEENNFMSVVLTSGTLEPISLYTNDLNFNFNQTYEGNHNINKEKNKIMILQTSILNIKIIYIVIVQIIIRKIFVQIQAKTF